MEVDEAKLPLVERLGLAYCRLNNWEWDEFIGPKPDGFDALPKYIKHNRLSSHKQRCKYDYIQPAIAAIESIIGSANASRFRWIYVLGKSEEDWVRWYVMEGFAFESQILRKPVHNPFYCRPKRF